MKRLLFVLICALALTACASAPTRSPAIIDVQATDTGPEVVCYTVTPVPSPTCPCPTCPAVGPTPTATPAAQPALPANWDPILTQHNAYVVRYPGARYVLIAAFRTHLGSWDTLTSEVKAYAWPFVAINGGGGDTHSFAIVLDVNGNPVVGKTVLLTWPGTDVVAGARPAYATDAIPGPGDITVNVDGTATCQTWDDGSCNFFTNASYAPDRGERPPYCVQVLNGDVACFGGLPLKDHWSSVGVWKALW